MKVAVVTDAVSSGSYFPAWYAYYGNLFGAGNIHIFTYQSAREAFDGFSLGSIHALSDNYNDDLRKDTIADFATELLRDNDAVLRVDVDEFLVPDPSKYSDLKECLTAWSGDHLTAFGFDVFQAPTEPVLDLRRPILAQRRFAYALTALNKTCVTRVPVKWNRGFHYCSLPPHFGEVFLLHTKRADIALQAEWNQQMRAKAANDEFVKNYYGWDLNVIQGYHANRFRLSLEEGSGVMDRKEFNRRFIEKIRYVEQEKIYDGPYDIEEINVAIPESYRHFF